MYMCVCKLWTRIGIDTDNQTEPIRGRINLTKYGLLVPVPQWYTSRERICGIGHFTAKTHQQDALVQVRTGWYVKIAAKNCKISLLLNIKGVANYVRNHNFDLTCIHHTYDLIQDRQHAMKRNHSNTSLHKPQPQTNTERPLIDRVSAERTERPANPRR